MAVIVLAQKNLKEYYHILLKWKWIYINGVEQGGKPVSVCKNASKRHLSWRHFSAFLLLAIRSTCLLIHEINL